jgi:hypothetical protein
MLRRRMENSLLNLSLNSSVDTNAHNQEKLNRALKHFLQSEFCEVRWIQLEPVTGLTQKEIRHRDRQCSAQTRAEMMSSGRITHTSVSHSRLREKRHHSQDQHGYLVTIGGQDPLGVDLENLSRKLHPRVEQRMLKRICSDEETKFALSPLEFWVIKEAAFKANCLNQGTFLKQYKLTSWNSETSSGQVMFKDALIRVCIVRSTSKGQGPEAQLKTLQSSLPSLTWLIAFAHCPKAK